MHLQQQISSWFFTSPQVWVDILTSDISQAKIYAHMPRMPAAIMVWMPNLLPPAGPTLPTHFMLTTHIKQPQLLPRTASLLSLQRTADTHCAVNLPSAEIHCSGIQEPCCASTGRVMLSKSITLRLYATRDLNEVSGWMAAKIDLLSINSKLVTEHLETLDKYRKNSRPSG